ncbi:MAG: DUF262 domain-containing protein [Chloroflexota bacterium]
MAYEGVKVRDIVERAVTHAWSIPEFQRGFVWKATQVRDLIESLWLNYPIGSLLVWDAGLQTVEEKNVVDALRPRWLVDGQQRATALSILFGRKPYWWTDGEEWEKTLRRYDIRFDVDASEPPFFVVANAPIRKAKGHRFIPLSRLLTLDLDKRADDRAKLQDLAKDIKLEGLCDGKDAMDVYSTLHDLAATREHDVPVIVIDHDLEDVVEIFARLNSRGTRVTEADIYLGIVAARTPKWVRTTFLPYLRTLEDAGFAISPNLLFRTLTAVGEKRVRFKEIRDEFWNREFIEPAWERTTRGWESLIARFHQLGVLSNDPMPTEAALVTAVALVERWPDASFEPVMYWFLQASRFGRYSGSGTTSLDEDLRDISEPATRQEALDRLLKRFDHEKPMESEDFLRDYGDSRFGRFILYLLVYRKAARDWDAAGHRIGFEGAKLLRDFRPQWHHIFPRKFLEGKVPDEEIDALANIAAIGPQINIRISAKDPLDYIDRYGITADKLEAQYITGSVGDMSVSNFRPWLERRAERMAAAANQFLSDLRTGG